MWRLSGEGRQQAHLCKAWRSARQQTSWLRWRRARTAEQQETRPLAPTGRCSRIPHPVCTCLYRQAPIMNWPTMDPGLRMLPLTRSASSKWAIARRGRHGSWLTVAAGDWRACGRGGPALGRARPTSLLQESCLRLIACAPASRAQPRGCPLRAGRRAASLRALPTTQKLQLRLRPWMMGESSCKCLHPAKSQWQACNLSITLSDAQSNKSGSH